MTIAQNILPEALLNVIESAEIDGFSILIESAEFKNEDLTLSFSITFDADVPKQDWVLTASGVKDEKICGNWSSTMDVYVEHPLLLKYKDTQTELYFKGTISHPDALFIDVFQSLLDLGRKLTHVQEYILIPSSIKCLSSIDSGLFARGPKTILDLYQKVLTKHNVKAYYLNDLVSPIGNEKLKLLKIGESFIVGETFKFEIKNITK